MNIGLTWPALNVDEHLTRSLHAFTGRIAEHLSLVQTVFTAPVDNFEEQGVLFVA